MLKQRKEERDSDRIKHGNQHQQLSTGIKQYLNVNSKDKVHN